MAENSGYDRRPWALLRDQSTHGPYADFAAWRKWMVAAESRLNEGGDATDVLGSIDATDDHILYGICCRIVDEVARV